MDDKKLPRIYCNKCDKFVAKYHCNTKKHILGLSKNLEHQLRKDYKKVTLIFN